MIRKLIQQAPIYGCAGFIAFLFMANIWNFAVERDWPHLRIRSASPLAGVAKIKPAPWSIDAFLSGETQRAVSMNLGRVSPVFPISVRAKNQLIFSLFNKSAASGVVIGRHNQLYEQYYIDEFCSRTAEFDEKHIQKWARTISDIERALTSLNKKFIYVISPSKAARYYEDLPASAICAPYASAMPDKLRPFIQALTDAGVHYVNAADLITKKRADYSVPLFPRGGTHWNSLGAALALREISEIAPSQLGRFDFGWRLAPQAEGTDRDILDLLNLLWPDITYPTTIIYQKDETPSCASHPFVLAMGGSFLHEILAAMTIAPCPPEIDYWFYMRTEDNNIELGHYKRAPKDASNGERLSTQPSLLDNNLRQADLIVLEENESNIGLMKQVGQLSEALRRIQ